MDKHYSEEFFSHLLEMIQKACRDYLQFNDSVELSGYLALDIDNTKKERYVLCELLNGAGLVVSESHCTKVFKTFTDKHTLQKSAIENIDIVEQNDSESPLHTVRVCGSSDKSRPIQQRYPQIQNILNNSEKIEIDLTNNNSDPPIVRSVSNCDKRQTRCSSSVTSPPTQDRNFKNDMFTSLVAAERNSTNKRKVNNSGFTNTKRTKSSAGSDIYTDTTGSRNQEKMFSPTSVNVKEESDENQTNCLLYSNSKSAELGESTAGLTDHMGTEADDCILQEPGTSSSLASYHSKHEKEEIYLQGTAIRKPCMTPVSCTLKPKRVCKLLNIETKYRLIRMVEAGVKKKSLIAREFGILPNTLSTIMKNKQTVITAWESCSFAPHRQRLCKSQYSHLEDKLYSWYCEAVRHGLYITGQMMVTKARELAQELGHKDFHPSIGYINKFKARHGILLVKKK